MATSTNPFDSQNAIPGIKKIIAVSSGKGGVGKSTITVNLAVALSQLGLKVGVLDADIYGPSVPRMFGSLNQKPEITDNNKIKPLKRFGVKFMSLGLLIEPDTAVIWRGPMLFKAMDQFFRDVEWGELDILLLDMPPGTGDVQLSAAQKVPLSGAIAVTTPQNVALIDVKRSIDMFDKVNVPLLGVVENMSYFIPSEGAQPIQLFPKGDLESYLLEKKLKKLGEIAFQTDLSMAGEIGIPVCESGKNLQLSEQFKNLARSVGKSLDFEV